MSLATARVRDSARSALPRLRLLVSPPRSGRRPKFITACVGVLVACLLVLLLLNIGLARGAYHEKQLTLQQTALMEQEQALSEQVSREGSPSALAAKARDLGMIENPTPAFIQLSDGTVLGEPKPAEAPVDGYDPASLTGKAPVGGSVVPPGVDPGAPPADIAPPAGDAPELPAPGQGTDPAQTPAPGQTSAPGQNSAPGQSGDGAHLPGGQQNSGQQHSGSPQPGASGNRVDDGAVPVGANR